MTITDESLPPLTTVFVPPPECSSFHFSCDIDFDRASPYLLTDCIPCAFPVRICGTNLEGSRSLLNCYPHVRTLRGTEFAKYFSDFDFVRPVETYVSGVSCPLGMDTAAQVAKKDGSETKICCPRQVTKKTPSSLKSTDFRLIDTSVGMALSAKQAYRMK